MSWVAFILALPTSAEDTEEEEESSAEPLLLAAEEFRSSVLPVSDEASVS